MLDPSPAKGRMYFFTHFSPQKTYDLLYFVMIYYGFKGAGAIAGIFIGEIAGVIIGGNVTSFLSKRWELDIPYCIFSYFEERNEQVISAQNIGKMIQYGRVEYFQGSHYYIVKTDKEIYIIESKENNVLSCSIQRKSDL